MALYKTEAIVLKAEDFGESHRLVTLLTPARGLVRAVAKGARRPTSRLAGALLPFTHARLLLWQGRSLDGISQAEVRQSFRALREDLPRMAGALYTCEVMGELVPEMEESAAAFRLHRTALGLLAVGARTDVTLRYFELQLLRLAGFGPRFDRCPACDTPVLGAPGESAGVGGGRTYFSPAAGGCLCPACLGRAGDAGTGGGLWLGAAAVGAARGLLNCRPRAVPALRFPAVALAELGAATDACLRHVLEKRPRSLAFWETVRGYS